MGILSEKSLHFAVRIIKLYRHLTVDKKEFVISKQIVRSGTSIGANINEADYGSSRADFINKMQIALKETAETEYWLNLLILSGYLSKQPGNDLLNSCLEIKRLLVSTVNTAKTKGQNVTAEIPPLE
jgi:four helix bundle protein